MSFRINEFIDSGIKEEHFQAYLDMSLSDSDSELDVTSKEYEESRGVPIPGAIPRDRAYMNIFERGDW